MNIASLSIKRPVLATVLSIIIVLFGIVGYTFLGLRAYPGVDPPIVNVTTTYTGANADVVETQITEPLESSINGIAGIRSLNSVSSDGRSNITVEFNPDVDMEAAANDVRDRVSRAVRNLPPDCDPPTVVKADADADAILILSVYSESRDLMKLSDIANNTFKERLQTIPGVSEIRIFGEKKYSMKLLMDPQRMASYQVTPGDIRTALTRENVELPSGRIEGYETELTIRTMGRLTTEQDFNELIIKENNGVIVKLRDIGEARLRPENERSTLKGRRGVPQVALAVNPQPGANHIAIADEFYKRLQKIKNDLPKDIQAEIILDTTVSIRKSISEVMETILIAFCLVVLIIFIFLRHWRTTLIPVIAIPISLIGAFFVMYLSGFTINILTLLGIVLATGLVVDDAIVVLENIYKKIENGEDPIQAGHSGSKEILFAIISTTITLAAVFLPIIFLQGFIGRLFREFAVVVAGSVLISAFVSLTLTPMMSARLLKKQSHHTAVFIMFEKFFDRMIEGYGRSLTVFLKHRYIALIIVFVSLGIAAWIGIKIPSELAPMEDKSRIRITATAPEGTAYEKMDRYMDVLAAIADTLPETENIMALTAPGFSSGSANSGMLRIMLSQPEKRTRTQQEIYAMMSGVLKRYNFARAYASQEQTISIGGGGGGGLPVQYVILAPNFGKLKEIVPLFLEKVNESKKFATVDVNLKFNKPEMRLEIDRERAKTCGVSVRDIAETLQLYFSGTRYGFFVLNNKQYYVIGQALRSKRDEPSDLMSVNIRNSRGELIQLSTLLKYSEYSNPPQLYRYNRYVSATISAQPDSALSLGEGINEMKKIGKQVLSDEFSSALAGTSRDYAESSGSLYFAFIFALILIYLVLAAQFESFRDPLIIMFTVPLAISGALISLSLFNQTLNIFSQIGVILLIGIVTKNGILIVEFANQRKAAGLKLKDAVIDAATARLRPILMTSLATVLGAVPIAFALGAASRSRVPLGVTIIGGLMFSLILTLYVIPALYTYLSKDKNEIH